ncbi:unnamed protein product, partial [Phaeothamnion confervicola]
FLVRCLHFADDDVTRAAAVASKFCQFRTRYGWPMRIRAPAVATALQSAVHWVLPWRDARGRAVVGFTPASIDPSHGSPEAYQKMLAYVLDEVSREKELSRKGVAIVVDGRNVGMMLLRHFGMEDYRRGLGMLTGAFPLKCKAIIVINPSRSVGVALKVATPLMGAKMRQRLQVLYH